MHINVAINANKFIEALTIGQLANDKCKWKNKNKNTVFQGGIEQRMHKWMNNQLINNNKVTR